jgi:hypothetical protein
VPIRPGLDHLILASLRLGEEVGGMGRRGKRVKKIKAGRLRETLTWIKRGRFLIILIEPATVLSPFLSM